MAKSSRQADGNMNVPSYNSIAEPISQQSAALRVVMLTVMLVAAWLLWSGFFKPLLLGLGAFSVILVVYLSHRLRLFDTDVFAFRFSLRLFKFWGWLFKEVILSSLEVSRLVLNPKMPISPAVFEFKTRCSHPVDVVILGNSITLTPGTLTLNINDGNLTVHSLTRQGIKDLEAGEMDRRIFGLRNH
jgi:multicomponent Na+:H+ antiporter subunit E